MKKMFYRILILFFLIGCKGIKNETINLQVLKVDLDKLSDKSFDDFYKLKEVIPLETNQDILIGYIKKVLLWNDTIFVMETPKAGYDMGDDTRLLVFDKAGNYLYKIDRKGPGPGEYNSMVDFFIDEKQNRIMVHSNSKAIFYYDKKGNFIEKEDFKRDYSYIEFIPNKNWLIINPFFNRQERENHLIHITDSEANIINSYSPMIQKGFGLRFLYSNISPIYIKAYKEPYWIIASLENTINTYNWKEDILTPIYKFDIKGYPELTLKEWEDIKDVDVFLKHLCNSFFHYKGEKTIITSCETSEGVQGKWKFNILITDLINGKVEVLESVVDKSNEIYDMSIFCRAVEFGNGILTIVQPHKLNEYTYNSENSQGYRLQQQVGEEDNPILLIYEER